MAAAVSSTPVVMVAHAVLSAATPPMMMNIPANAMSSRMSRQVGGLMLGIRFLNVGFE